MTKSVKYLNSRKEEWIWGWDQEQLYGEKEIIAVADEEFREKNVQRRKSDIVDLIFLEKNPKCLVKREK